MRHTVQIYYRRIQFIAIKQGENEPVLAYRQRFEALKQAVKSTLVKNNENPDH